MIIADTGFFVALINQREEEHNRAVNLISTLTEPLITTYPVITETCYLLLKTLGNKFQCDFLTEVARGSFEVFDLKQNHIERAVLLMERYADLPMDFADASLIVLAEHLSHGRILTVDRRDFSIYRWNDRHPFENLLYQ